jgi:hypothetical protein
VLTRHRVVLVAAALVVATGFARRPAHTRDVTVHEWGTFTSVAGEDGRAVAWFPLDGPVDLPCFVRRSYQVSSKGAMFASVRMETPVLYFYTSEAVTLDVRVGFRQGLITEYFPPARITPEKVAPAEMIEPGLESSINWRDVRILPGAAPEFLTERSPNHYYAARATDAAPIEAGGDRERFLFYRGVGTFDLPITATVVQGNDVIVTGVTGNAVSETMLFENRGGRIGHRLHTAHSGPVLLSRAEPNDGEDNIDSVRAALQGMLEDAGLYPREANAMIETWRDSWFTEGARILYLVPRASIDAVLPLRIDPAPARLIRVFVGRLELATDATLSDIRTAALSSDEAGLRKYGRFLQAFADRLLAGTDARAERATLAKKLEAAQRFAQPASACR